MTVRNSVKKFLLIVVGLLIGLVLAEMVVRVHAASELRHVPRKHYVDTPAAPGTIRMAVLGGSTANGSPYVNVMGRSPKSGFNLLSITGFLLEQRYGCPEVKVDNYSGPNWSAQTAVEHYFERPGPKPDVLVLYTGQNETTRYYSPNMVPPPAFLSPLARLQSGNLLLRRLFTRQVVPADQRYTGTFFSDNVIPSYERGHNLSRYRRYVERMIRHAAAEGILLIIVIPQSNYLFPPTRSVYEGPSGRKAEALRLFKKVWKARYVDDDGQRALRLLEQLQGFCSFADLYYEIGDLHYVRGDVEAALPYLRRAREMDGFPICITPVYREVLRELVEEHDVPSVDMDDLIRERLGRPAPDYASFLDDCHLYLDVYEALSRDLIRVMRANTFGDLKPGGGDSGLSREEWAGALGVTPAVWREALIWEADYHASQSDYSFRKLSSLKRARSYLQESVQQGLATGPGRHADDMVTAERRIRAEEARMRTWIQHDGPMPIGAAFTGEPPEGFGGRAEIEASQGDALMEHGQWALAVGHYRKALSMDPDAVRARANLGFALYNLGRFDEAVDAFDRVLALEPQLLTVRRNMGKVLLELKRFDEAIVQFREAARIAPDDAEVTREYCEAAGEQAWRLATSAAPAVRDGHRAVSLAEEVCEVTAFSAYDMLDTLAAAYAAVGRFEDAVRVATQAETIARQHGSPAAGIIAGRLKEYRAGRPWREAEEYGH